MGYRAEQQRRLFQAGSRCQLLGRFPSVHLFISYSISPFLLTFFYLDRLPMEDRMPDVLSWKGRKHIKKHNYLHFQDPQGWDVGAISSSVRDNGEPVPDMLGFIKTVTGCCFLPVPSVPQGGFYYAG